MNFKHIIKEIEQADASQPSGRREVLKSVGSKVALAALPFALGSVFNKAFGQTNKTVVAALNYMLELEYFQYNFYHQGNNTGGLIPASDQAGFATIEAQELAHINFLKNAIIQLGGVPFTPKGYSATAVNPNYVPTAYDFQGAKSATYYGIFINVFSNYATFLVAAQIFEDTCIHAYQGQMPTWLTNIPILKQMMQIQAAEARQAGHVRLLRRLPPLSSVDLPAPWITNNIPPHVSLQPFYYREDNTAQMGLDISSLQGATEGSTIPKLSATAAFDEAYDMATVNSLLAPFKL
jgi:hypothetical protein